MIEAGRGWIPFHRHGFTMIRDSREERASLVQELCGRYRCPEIMTVAPIRRPGSPEAR